MAEDIDKSASRASIKIGNQNPSAGRFRVPVEQCDVTDKEKLVRYRQKWMQWMAWYEHSESEPHSIESQIHRMLFNDLTYRAMVSVRESVDADLPISARSATLAYLLDHGYVVSQVLAIQRLLDPSRGVISVRRLLKDVEKHRQLITREVYVAGDGLPYDYTSWTQNADKSNPEIQIWGIEAPGLARFAISKNLNETFDLLSGKQAHERSRDDIILKAIFKTLESWISCPSTAEITQLRNIFIAHSADAVHRGLAQFTGVKLSQIDEIQRAIVRVERALTDYVLSIRVARDVVPLPPLGIFRGLDSPYSSTKSEESMHHRWDELTKERNGWKRGILQDFTPQ